MTIKRPSDKTERVLQTYLTDLNPQNTILRLLVVPTVQKVSGILGENPRPPDMRNLSLAKRFNALTHADPDQSVRIFGEANLATS